MPKRNTINRVSERTSDSHRDNSRDENEKEISKRFLKKLALQSLLGAFRNYFILLGLRGVYKLAMTVLSSAKRGTNKQFNLRDSFFGKDAHRMAFVFSGFTFTWKVLSRLLPRTNALSKDVNYFIAGSLSGLFILFEKRNFRSQYWQTLLFRSLQSGALTLYQKTGISVPYGSQLFFTIVATQVLYAFVLFPNTLPPSELKLMFNMSKVPPNLFEINRRILKRREKCQQSN
ncbi:hypothetical protein DSO57_1009360 [Entomophthora muscae]|uniref:Uncharacterized protein n=1 Tax=Entomophthora muscae TaxID=34485 RepID=A0ACC2TTY0_9FUNG|nr:hypothetical protein DSO57_1009360 [Entomophthora muscae]